MKSLLFVLILGGFLYPAGWWQEPKQHFHSGAKPSFQDSSYYKNHIQPILEKRCSPCHFTGGKMYEKLPFDNPVTITLHETGVLKRIKDEKEKSLVSDFITRAKPQ
jgi:hypothetical protein